jgi:hypothetical protein
MEPIYNSATGFPLATNIDRYRGVHIARNMGMERSDFEGNNIGWNGGASVASCIAWWRCMYIETIVVRKRLL